MRVAIISNGYVGLVSETCFANFGLVVTCIDKDVGKIERLKDGVIPIYEPGLESLVASNVGEERLFSPPRRGRPPRRSARRTRCPSPWGRRPGHADLSYVYAAAEKIAGLIDGFTVIITKSTVPVGTGKEVETIVRKTRPDARFAVISNPKFLREGAAISDFKRPDRVVMGTDNEQAKEVMRELYRPSSSTRHRSCLPNDARRS